MPQITRGTRSNSIGSWVRSGWPRKLIAVFACAVVLRRLDHVTLIVVSAADAEFLEARREWMRLPG
jgi:hypothetical protein